MAWVVGGLERGRKSRSCVQRRRESERDEGGCSGAHIYTHNTCIALERRPGATVRYGASVTYSWSRAFVGVHCSRSDAFRACGQRSFMQLIYHHHGAEVRVEGV